MKKPMFSTMIVSAFFILISGCVPSAEEVINTTIPSTQQPTQNTSTPTVDPAAGDIAAGIYTGTVSGKFIITEQTTGQMATNEIPSSVETLQVCDSGLINGEGNVLAVGNDLYFTMARSEFGERITSVIKNSNGWTYPYNAACIMYLDTGTLTFTGSGNFYIKKTSANTFDYYDSMTMYDTTGIYYMAMEKSGTFSK